jgi:hypothetical protein
LQTKELKLATVALSEVSEYMTNHMYNARGIFMTQSFTTLKIDFNKGTLITRGRRYVSGLTIPMLAKVTNLKKKNKVQHSTAVDNIQALQMQAHILSPFSSEKIFSTPNTGCIPIQNQGHSNYQYKQHGSYYCQVHFQKEKIITIMLGSISGEK